MSDRQRNGLILLLVAGLIAASAVVIAIRPTILGLDLKGGIELVYKATGTPQDPKVTSANLTEAVQAMDKRVNSLGVAEPSIQTEGSNLIDVQLPNVKNVAQAEKEVGDTQRLAFYDWEANVLVPPTGGAKAQFAAAGMNSQDAASELISQGTANSTSPGESSSGAGAIGLYQAVKLASEQPAYISKAANSRQGPEYFLFGAPGSSACAAQAAANGTKAVAGVHCLLSGPITAISPGQSIQQSVDAGLTPAQTKGGQLLTVKQGWVVLQGSATSLATTLKFGDPTAGYYVLRDDAALFGNEITSPQESTDQSGSPSVTFGFNSKGATAFANVTAEIAKRGSIASIGVSQAVDEHFAAVLGNQIITVPYIDWKMNPDGINGSQGSEISGSFTVSSADQLASFLRLGALPVNLQQISDTTVSATLGAQALHQGVIAGIIGLSVVIVFLLAYYRLLGAIAVAGLAAYGVYFYALIKLIPVTLTLAGIAGLVLTIGVAADANIVIFERVKEEIRAGRSIRNGIIEGYKKGLSAIIDANVVTIMTAFILFVLATADVKGFAFTLGIGTFASLFTAVMATQAILMTLGTSKTLARPSALGGKKHRRWSYDFMGASRYFFTLSGIILLIGGFAIGGRGLNLGIDFTSGTQISVGLSHPATVNQVKAVMASVGEGDATVQAVHGDKALGPDGFQIQSKYLSATKQDTLRSDLESKFGIRSTNTGNQDFNPTSVGPTFGSAVTHSAIVAVIASLLVISLYVALRFDWKYAVPVLIALAHDLLISIGVYALLGRVVTTDTVAALLTILGYSMYDTIIVFDRVRENTKRMPQATFSQIMNRSMSEVLTRSLATTACTLLPVIALLIFGGSTLQDFAFALLVGVASGAYSSIFIASPVLMHWKEREHGYRLRRERIINELGYVPAYAGAGADIDPERGLRGRGGRLTTPSPDGVSASEFEAMKRELGLDDDTGSTKPSGGRHSTPPTQRPGSGPGGRTQRARPQTAPAPAPEAPKAQTEPTPENETFEHAPDRSTDDAVLPDNPRAPRNSTSARGRNKKHGRR